MKKGLLVILFALFAMSNVNAQFSLGVGGSLFSDGTALELRGNYTVGEKFSIVPYFDYFVSTDYGTGSYSTSDYKLDVSFMMYGVDGHYSLGDPDAFDYYPLLGVNIFSAHVSVSSTEDSSINYSTTVSHTGLALGGGLTYALSDSAKLFAELRYLSHGNSSGTGLSAGVLFNL